MWSNVSVQEFFHAVKEGEVTDLEVHNYIEAVTHKFQRERLELLLKDLGFFIFKEREEREAGIAEQELPDAIARYKKMGKPLPYRSIPDITDIVKNPGSKKTIEILDVERLCYPFEFFRLYLLRDKITSLLEGEKPLRRAVTINQPSFKKEKLPQVLECLCPFFSDKQQPLLKKLLETVQSASERLVFMESGNKLADAFRQLYDAHLITGCDKKGLESWVRENFAYTNKGQIWQFTEKYLNDIISSNTKECQSPILNVKKGEVIPLSRNKKRNNNL